VQITFRDTEEAVAEDEDSAERIEVWGKRRR